MMRIGFAESCVDRALSFAVCVHFGIGVDIFTGQNTNDWSATSFCLGAFGVGVVLSRI